MFFIHLLFGLQVPQIMYRYDVHPHTRYIIDGSVLEIDSFLQDGSAIVRFEEEESRLRLIADDPDNPACLEAARESVMFQAVHVPIKFVWFLPLRFGILRLGNGSNINTPVQAIKRSDGSLRSTIAVSCPVYRKNFIVQSERESIRMLSFLAKQLREFNALGYYCYKLSMRNVVKYSDFAFLYNYGSCQLQPGGSSIKSQLPFIFELNSKFMRVFSTDLRDHIMNISNFTASAFDKEVCHPFKFVQRYLNKYN